MSTEVDLVDGTLRAELPAPSLLHDVGLPPRGGAPLACLRGRIVQVVGEVDADAEQSRIETMYQTLSAASKERHPHGAHDSGEYRDEGSWARVHPGPTYDGPRYDFDYCKYGTLTEKVQHGYFSKLHGTDLRLGPPSKAGRPMFDTDGCYLGYQPGKVGRPRKANKESKAEKQRRYRERQKRKSSHEKTKTR